MDFVHVILVTLVGFVAGFVNTLAGAGSLLTLPLLMFMGLPANVANGTNRIGIFLQSFVATRSFKKQKAFSWREGIYLGIPAVFGSVLGALSAISLDQHKMRITIGILLLVMLLMVIAKPDVWIKGHAGQSKAKSQWWQIMVLFAIGFYGGFIQAGVGYFLLAGLVLVCGYNLVKANALKVFIVLLFTPFALVIYMYNHQVNYLFGIILALGSSAGAYVAAHSAIKWGASYIRWMVILTLIISISDFLGFFKWISSFFA